MNIALIEPVLSGHRAEYLRWIIRALLRRGHRVFVATFDESLKHPAAQRSLIEYGDAISIATDPTPKFGSNTESFLRMSSKMMTFRTAFKRLYRKVRRSANIDFTFLPFLDYCTYAMALAGSPFEDTPWGGIVMRPAFHYSALEITAPRFRTDSVKRRLFCRLLRNRYLRTVLTIDPTLHQYISGLSSEFTKRLMFIPEPSDVTRLMSQEQAKKGLGISGQGSLLLVYGTLNGKKGINELLQATHHPSFPSDMHILLAGKQNEGIKAICRTEAAVRLTNSGLLHAMDRYLNKTEEKIVFSAADYVWIGYRDHFQMSGVMVQAGKMGLPVIACEEGLIGWLTRQYQSGVVVSVSRSDSIAQGIRELYDNPERAQRYGTNGCLAYTAHTVENFSRIIIAALEG